MRRFIFAAAVTAAATLALAAGAVAGNGNVPATQATFNDTYSATFVRSASGLVMETNRVNSAGAQNGWTSADVWLQFRPTTGYPPNPACDPDGLVTQPFLYVNNQQSLNAFFDTGRAYNVCVYLVNPQVASGMINSESAAGATATLPTNLSHFRIDVSGTWQNGPYGPVDAEFTSLVDPWVSYEDGFEHSPYLLGEGFGDVQVNGQFVDWGAYSVSHEYSLLASLSGPEVILSIFDGDSNTNTVMPWYGDNTGWLDYTITYVGP
jgi:hypothetical protein